MLAGCMTEEAVAELKGKKRGGVQSEHFNLKDKTMLKTAFRFADGKAAGRTTEKS